MLLAISPRAFLIILSAFAFTAANLAEGQTAPAASPPAASPATPSSPSRVEPPDELQYSAVGASAQCNDGTFFHGNVDTQSCAEHRGIRKLLQGRGQDLIR